MAQRKKENRYGNDPVKRACSASAGNPAASYPNGAYPLVPLDLVGVGGASDRWLVYSFWRIATVPTPKLDVPMTAPTTGEHAG